MSLDFPSVSPEAATNQIAQPSSLVGKGERSADSPRSLTVADLLARVVAARDLDKQQCPPQPWLWHGYLGPGKVTLLTSQWKSGKTTLVSLLLARMQHGGELAGLAVAAGKAFVISEETETDWRLRLQHLGIPDQADLLCLPLMAPPSMDVWLALIETAAAMRLRQGSDLVVIDALSKFLPAHSENSAGALMECLTPLKRLAAAGMSVLLLHHPRKGKTTPGQAARGSGALPSFVDIIIEMDYYGQRDDLDRRRRLLAFSRHEQTPRHLLIELQADGRDYVVLQSGLEAAIGENWPAVLHALSEAHSKLTRHEILDRWPADYSKPDSSTLWRWLSRAVAQGLVRQQGTGRNRDPFRYWLPAREDMMRPEGGTLEELEAWNNRCVTELLDLPDNGETKPSVEAPVSEEEEDGAGAAMAAAEAGTMAAEPAPPTGAADDEATQLGAGPDASSSPGTPGADATRLAAEPEAPVQLPYPFNIMNPADVPAEVWQRARAAKENSH